MRTRSARPAVLPALLQQQSCDRLSMILCRITRKNQKNYRRQSKRAGARCDPFLGSFSFSASLHFLIPSSPLFPPHPLLLYSYSAIYVLFILLYYIIIYYILLYRVYMLYTLSGFTVLYWVCRFTVLLGLSGVTGFTGFSWLLWDYEIMGLKGLDI